MTRHALARVPSLEQTPTHAPRRRKPHELARVTLFNPRTIGALHSVQQLGHTLRCRLIGTTLVVEVDGGAGGRA